MTDAPDTLGLPIDRDVCFSTPKGQFHQGTMKRQLKILRPLVPWLKQLLRPGEQVRLAVRACSPMSWLQQLTLGWVIFYSKRCLLVFTSERILHFPTGVRFAPKRSVAQIMYGDLAGTKLSGFLGRALTLTYRTGKKEAFNYVQSPEFKKLKTLLPSLPKGGQPSPASERHHLCPRCRTPLVKARFDCPHCHLAFKDGERARRLSWLYPGGGYFYTGHPILGVLDAVTETILLVAVLAGLVDVLIGGGAAEDWVSVVVLAGLLVIEKVETVYHAQHYVNEYIPVETTVTPVPATP